MNVTAEHMRTLREYARDTGAFRVNSGGATDLAAACSAAIKAAEDMRDLIKTARNLEAWISDYVPDDLAGRQVELRELRAALARVGGALA